MDIKVDMLTKLGEQSLITIIPNNHTTKSHIRISTISNNMCLFRETITTLILILMDMTWIIKITIILDLKTKGKTATKQIHFFKTVLLHLLILQTP